MDTPSRREFLYVSGVVGTAALAGCSGSSSTPESDGSGGDTDTDTATPTATESGSSGGSEWTQTSTVEMTNGLKFAPKRIEVSAGTTVTWENAGSVPHSVTAYEEEIPDGATYFASGGADSQSAAEEAYPDQGRIGEDGSYEYTFETKGTYEYYCIPHEMNGMVGFVKVV